MPSNNRLLDFDLMRRTSNPSPSGCESILKDPTGESLPFTSPKGDGARPSSRTVTSRRPPQATGEVGREERHVRGHRPLANQVPHMLE
jgi:hypothetical protein